MKPHVFLAALACTLSAVPAFAAWPHDPAINVPVCTAPSYQQYPTPVADGAGGAIVTWFDYRSGTSQDVYAQRFDRDGNMLWTTNGVAAYATTRSEVPMSIASDGAGGAYIGIELTYSSNDHDIYLTRVLANGTIGSGWPKSVNTATTNDIWPMVASDGSNGVYVAWNHNYGTAPDIYATHFDGAGGLVAGWTATGMAICTGAWGKYLSAALADGSGGVILVWLDSRNDEYDTYVQRLRANGTAMWTANGMPGLATTGSQYVRDAIADGNGGVFVADEDTRAGGSDVDVYLGHVLADGTYPGMMSAVGAAVATGSAVQNMPQLALDGAGGAYVGYTQAVDTFDQPYVMRMTGAGEPSPSWAAGGLRLSGDACDQSIFGVVADGLGGAYVMFKDFCSTSLVLNVSRVLPNRATAQGWPYGGIAISPTALAAGLDCPGIVDDNHDLIAVWEDGRDSDGLSVYAQKVDHNGVLGAPAPSIASVKDVRPDQGGQLRLAWNAGWPDNEIDRLVTSYSIWRQVPASLALAAARASAARPARTIETEPSAAGTIYWELVGTQPAAYTAGYSYLVPTEGDSVAGANPRTIVRVRAVTAAGAFWDSAPDSGYSVDNLAPATPAAFTGTYAHGTGTFLTWNGNLEPDLAGYRLYRGSTPGFVPGSANLVVEKADPGYFDAGAAPAYYRLGAVDVHGNVSATALLLPNGTTDADPARPLTLALAPVSPNPARGGARVAWTQPVAARVTLAVFDPLGRCVRTLVDGERNAGGWSETWDGRNSAGTSLGSGLYFARLTCGGRQFTQRFAFVR